MRRRGIVVAPPTDIDRLLAEAELSQETEELILDVVTTSRLWPSERAEVTEELIAHFLDGRESGRSERELVRGFGDRAVTSTLVQLAQRRRRPMMWHASRAMLAGIGVLLAFVGAAYGYRALSFRMSTPIGWTELQWGPPRSRPAVSPLTLYASIVQSAEPTRSEELVRALRAATRQPVAPEALPERVSTAPLGELARLLKRAWSVGAEPAPDIREVQRAAAVLHSDAANALRAGDDRELRADVAALSRLIDQLQHFETPRTDVAALHVQSRILSLLAEVERRASPELVELFEDAARPVELRGTRRYFELVFVALYGNRGQLTAQGLELVRLMKGWHEPSRWDRVMEPGWYLFPASGADVRERFEALVDSAEQGIGSQPPTETLKSLLSSTWQCLRYPAVSVVGPSLYQVLGQAWSTNRARRRLLEKLAALESV